MACSDSDCEYLRGVVMEQSANQIDPSRNALFDTRLTRSHVCRVRPILKICEHVEGGQNQPICTVQWLRR
jgi:hypothetical protein